MLFAKIILKWNFYPSFQFYIASTRWLDYKRSVIIETDDIIDQSLSIFIIALKIYNAAVK
jgi:polyferredoxin